MKLSKKRISILATVCALTLFLVFVFCSFTFPSFSTDTSDILTVNSISSLDVGYLNSIIDKQSILGMFNSQEFICLVYDGTKISALFYPPTASLSGQISVADNTVTFQLSPGNYFTHVYFTASGFTMFKNNSRSISYTLSNVISYRFHFTDAFTFNSNFVYSSDTLNPTIVSVSTYWTDYFNRVLNGDPSVAESAYQSGFTDGFDSGYFDGVESGLIWGEELGYQEGYTEGYQEGIGTGYRDGFLAGEAEGYDTGYADGYQDGYDTGYSDGLEDAPPETVTIVIYEEPVEIDVPGIISSVSSIPDSILSGSFDFEFAGINIYGLLKLLIIVFIISAVIFFIIKRSA